MASLTWQEGYQALWTDDDPENRKNTLKRIRNVEINTLWVKLFPSALVYVPRAGHELSIDELRECIYDRLFVDIDGDYIRKSVRKVWYTKPHLPHYIKKHVYFVHHMLLRDYPSRRPTHKDPHSNSIIILLHWRSRRAHAKWLMVQSRIAADRERIRLAVTNYKSELTENLRRYRAGEQMDPIESFTVIAEPKETSETCPVCLEATAPVHMVTFPCGTLSVAHGTCIVCTTHLRSRADYKGISCPVCRNNVTQYFGNAAIMALCKGLSPPKLIV